MHHYITQEAYRILAQVNQDKNKVDVYERAEPSLMLRNLAMSTSVVFPDKDASFREANFGAQKVKKNVNFALLFF